MEKSSIPLKKINHEGEADSASDGQNASFSGADIAILTIPTLLWWKNSILWVSLMSIYAIVISHLAAYSAAHAEKAASQALNESGEANKKIDTQSNQPAGQ
jgi:hypothetical protein